MMRWKIPLAEYSSALPHQVRIKRALLIGGFLICALLSCSPAPQSATFHAFGTEVSVTLEDVSKENAKKLFQHIDQQLQTMHHRWHAWQDSELSSIRQACQTGKSVQVSQDLVYLLERGKQLEKQSLGYFNPAMGELIDAWGFLSHTSDQSREAPSDETIARLLSYHPSMDDIHINNHRVNCTNPHVRLDLGAYAKGYGVGLIMDYLKAEGVKSALVNAGGDLMVLQPPNHQPRRIGIQSPTKEGTEKVLSLKKSTSIFTSGTYARFFEDSQTSQTFHHLINPKTGYPSTYFISATVIHPDPLLADAAATALLASDKESWLAIIRSMGIDSYLLITAEGERIVSLPGDMS
jgi:FAD:protein FMN transferase